MKLIIILVCLGLQRYLGIRFSLSNFDWFKPYTNLLKGSLASMLNGFVGVAIVALPVAVVVSLVYWIFSGIAIGLLGFLISIAVLFYIMDGRDMKAQLGAYLGDSKEGDPAKEVSEFLCGKAPEGAAEKAREITKQVFGGSFRKVFAVLFWYLFFGVFGALLYFMIRTIHCRADTDFPELKEANTTVLGAMDWAPSRLLGLTLAMVGSFGAVFGRLMSSFAGGLEKSKEYVIEFGLAAVGKDPADVQSANVEENRAALDLIFRSLIVWVAFIALVTIIHFI